MELSNWPSLLEAVRFIRRIPLMLINLIVLCCLPILGLVTSVAVPARANPQQLAYSKA